MQLADHISQGHLVNALKLVLEAELQLLAAEEGCEAMTQAMMEVLRLKRSLLAKLTTLNERTIEELIHASEAFRCHVGDLDGKEERGD